MPNSNLLTENRLNALLGLLYNCGGNDVVSSGNIYKNMAENGNGEVQNSARRQAESALSTQPPTTPIKFAF